MALCSRLLAGMSPRRATYFSLLRQRKVGKRKATPLSASLRFAAGDLRCSRGGGRPQTRLRLRHASFLIPATLRCSAQPEGRESCTGRRCAWPGRAWGGCGLGLELDRIGSDRTGPDRTGVGVGVGVGPSAAMARAYSCPLDAPSSAALGGQGPRMFEPQASLRGPRLARAAQVARSFAAGRSQWARLFFAHFLLAKQKKVSPPPGGHPGSDVTSSASSE